MSLQTPDRLHATAVIRNTVDDLGLTEWSAALENATGFGNLRAFNAAGDPVPANAGSPAFFQLTPDQGISNENMVAVFGAPSLPLDVGPFEIARIGPPPAGIVIGNAAIDTNPDGDLVFGGFTLAFGPVADGDSYTQGIELYEVPVNVQPTA